jgi:hypothetical protein
VSQVGDTYITVRIANLSGGFVLNSFGKKNEPVRDTAIVVKFSTNGIARF